MSITDKLTTVAENVPKVYEAGKKSEYDAFWDALQQNGNRTNYDRAFTDVWVDEMFKPKYNVKPKGYGLSETFKYSRIMDIKSCFEKANVVLDTSECFYFHQTFQYSSTWYTPKIDARKATTFSYVFSGSSLRKIELMVSETTPYNNAFNTISSLKELYIEGTIGQNGFNVSGAVNINKESVVSIINALSTTTTGLSITLSSRTVTNAFGSVDNAEWQALVSSKPNWTISLV